MLSSAIRVRHNMLETPIYELGHPDTGSHINFVGMVHLGQQSYYDKIARYTENDMANDSIVHYEMIKPASSEEKAVYPQIIEQASSLNGLGAMVDLLARHTNNTVKQKEALIYRPEWQNHDISIVGLVRRLGPDGIKRLADAIQGLHDAEKKIDPEIFGKIVRGAFRLMPLISTISPVFEDHRVKSVVVDYRNQVAVSAVMECLRHNPAQNITMLWGSGHAPGITGELKKLGYRTMSRQWLGAMSLAAKL